MRIIQLTEAPRPAQRIKKNLKEKYHLPDKREPLFIFYKEHHPNIIINPPIRTSLIEDINKKDSDVVYLMNTAQKTIDSYANRWIHIYADWRNYECWIWISSTIS